MVGGINDVIEKAKECSNKSIKNIGKYKQKNKLSMSLVGMDEFLDIKERNY